MNKWLNNNLPWRLRAKIREQAKEIERLRALIHNQDKSRIKLYMKYIDTKSKHPILSHAI